MVHALTLEEIATLVGGKVDGDGSALLTDLRDLRSADASTIAYLALGADERLLKDCSAGAFLLAQGVDACGRPAVRVADPAVAAAHLGAHFDTRPRPEPGVHPSAVVDASATLDPSASIGPLCVVGPGCRVGADTILENHVVLAAGTLVGERCILHPHCVLGSDGFGFVWDGERHLKVPQRGSVVIGNDVEIGSNSCVDRGTLGATEIGDGTKIDNQVQVGHNCVLGRHVILCGQVGLSGSTVLEDGVVMGGRAATVGHLTIGAGAQLGGGAVATRNVPAGAKMLGDPAQELGAELRQRAVARRQAREN